MSPERFPLTRAAPGALIGALAALAAAATGTTYRDQVVWLAAGEPRA